VSILIVAVLFWIVPIAVANSIAKGKGREGQGFVLGLFLSWIGVLIVALLPALHSEASGERKCPHCAEWVKREASVCRFCGRDIAELAAPG
jgi:hypothetical protein